MTYSPSFDRAGAASLWDFGGIDYMNHGSYGACPKPVQEFHRALERPDAVADFALEFGHVDAGDIGPVIGAVPRQGVLDFDKLRPQLLA